MIPEVAVIYVPGVPIAKARPKFVRRGKFVTTYNPQETEEGRFMWQASTQWKRPPIAGPISLKLVFLMPIPKSTSKKRAMAMASGEIRHTSRPDLDNLVKFVKDALNEVVWKDDSQIWFIEAVKHYELIQPGTRIGIQWEEGRGLRC